MFLSFDTPVPEDVELRLKERETNFRTLYSSPNMERELDRREQVPWGDEPYLQAGVLPLSVALTQIPPQQPSAEEVATFSAKVAQLVQEKLA